MTHSAHSRVSESRDTNSDLSYLGRFPRGRTECALGHIIQTRLLQPRQAIECALQDEGGGVLINHGSALFAADVGRDSVRGFDRNTSRAAHPRERSAIR